MVANEQMGNQAERLRFDSVDIASAPAFGKAMDDPHMSPVNMRHEDSSVGVSLKRGLTQFEKL